MSGVFSGEWVSNCADEAENADAERGVCVVGGRFVGVCLLARGVAATDPTLASGSAARTSIAASRITFFARLTGDLLDTDDEAGVVVDRYHTPDVVQVADGVRMDRAALVAHAVPVRTNRPRTSIDVHEAMADGRHLAARYTMHVEQGATAFDIDVHFFGEFEPDGRMRRAHMLTRTADEEPPA